MLRIFFYLAHFSHLRSISKQKTSLSKIRIKKNIGQKSVLSPLGKRCCATFDQTWVPFTQQCFVASLVEFGLSCSVHLKVDENKTVYRWTDRQRERLMASDDKESSLEQKNPLCHLHKHLQDGQPQRWIQVLFSPRDGEVGGLQIF